MTNNEKTTVSCIVCNKPIYRKPSKQQANKTGLFFCSREHRAQYRTTSVTLSCAVCGTPVTRKPSSISRNTSGIVFCSREHQSIGFQRESGIDARSGPLPSSSSTRRSPKSACLVCGKPRREIHLNDGLCHYCDKRKTLIQQWLSGDLSVTYSGKSREARDFVKEYLIETRGDACEVCGECPRRADGTSVIQMNHIDGDYQNNLIENLELLCPNHHAITETWGSKNKSRGRRTAYREILDKQ